ncbi:hypothetical protein RMSM_07033 [Rhodopirellula maiorica SM1]|uniref:DUF3467 domain-containing protein n=1 Tax=Rhodopirellula maiorica SM1 TaxID=1265738 RepID=M5RAF5_9BACT|nr:DUF3467 domain-containing protein [Rhodopirellula maiorica]EMI16046.1 hypothetical protein RMSM_07033 [Rhodopirellula maiorica SM1]
MNSEPESSPDPADPNPALRARVPDHVAEGCFSTGAIVMTGPSEFIIDFLQTIGRPHRVASRVVIPHPVMPQFIDALQTNLDLYRNRFGDPPSPPTNPQQNQPRRPTPQEIYDDLKMADHVLSGAYANGVMIGHGASEFGLDFLTSFFPQSAVSSRVFVAAGQVPRLLDSLKGAVKQLEQRRQQQTGHPPEFPGNSINPTDGPSEPDTDPNRSDFGVDGGQGRYDGGSAPPNPDSPPDNDPLGDDSGPKA